MPNPSGETLDAIVDEITQQMEEISQLRDGTLSRSRRLIRDCAHSIRAMHRHELAKAAGDAGRRAPRRAGDG